MLKKKSCRYALVLFLISGLCFCGISTAARAAGVSFGVGVDLGPGYVAPPPPAYEPPAAVEVAPAPPPVVEAVPAAPVVSEPVSPPVVVEHPVVVEQRTAPVVVSRAPVVVERRSTVSYYYYPSTHYSQRVETRRDYWNGSSYREDEYEY
ncbi:MAG: hypothetical protein ACP5SH_13095 [Syntrophobacteraceae bacterium]